MRFYFKNDEELKAGISILAEDLGLEIVSAEDAEVKVTVIKEEKRTVCVTLDGKDATISYGDGSARFFRGLAILAEWVRAGEEHKSVTENPLFQSNGAMVDMSRNSVMNVKTVKTMLRKMALMGLNTYMLYTEDTYEIKEHPYFGYMRGRYTCEEIRELDRYALDLGIELIPCIQALGHLATHLRWDAASPYRDTTRTLLVGADATYELIDHMLSTISKCFTTRRVHLGMDETHDLGVGAYLAKNGYRERQEIYFEHLRRVADMARAHGLSPMMWSDMFFRLAGKNLADYADYDTRVEFTDEVAEKVPQGFQQVFWDYYHQTEDFYAINLEKHHKLFGPDVVFAGGIWTWSSPCPLYSRSLLRTLPALEACRNQGTKEIFATIWQNNGCEGTLIVGLAGLAWYADFDYKGVYDEASMKACFDRTMCGASYDDMMKLELPDHPDGGYLGLTRAFLYNDPMVGVVDKHIDGLEVQNYYRETTKTIAKASGNMGLFAPIHDTILKLSSLLENKTDFGVRLKKAYDAGDREILTEMRDECDVILEKLRAVRDSHRVTWMTYYKPFGWEVHDIRYGGQIARFETTKERIDAYLKGEVDRLEELEETRLRMDGQLAEDAEPRFHSLFNWMGYRDYATANTI